MHHVLATSCDTRPAVDRAALLEEALVLRSWCRFSVIPVRGKKALCDWEPFSRRRCSDREASRMFAREGVTGLAVVFGRCSCGLAGRDFDTPEGYLEWADRNPEIASDCPTVKTPRGYLVLLRLRVPPPFGVLPMRAGGGKGELRAAGCYSLLPPSLHPSGQVYEWLGERPHFESDFPRMSLEATGFLKSRVKPAHNLPKKPSRGVSVAPVFTHHSEKHSNPAESKAKRIKDAVIRSVPSRVGVRHFCLLGLVLRLRQLDWFGDNDPHFFRAVFEQWWELAEPVVGTKDREQSFREFADAWRTVPHGIHEGAIGQAIAWRLNQPLPESPLPKLNDEPTRKLVAVCEVLQRVAGDDEFFLSGREAERICGFSNQRTASNRLKSLVNAGVLAVVRAGIPSATLRVATRYRYLGAQSSFQTNHTSGERLAA